MTTKQEVSMLELVFSFGYYFMIGGVIGVLWEDSRRIQKLEMENFHLKRANSGLKEENSRLKEDVEEYDN